MSKLWRRGSTSGTMEAPEPGKRGSIEQLRSSFAEKEFLSRFSELSRYLATGGRRKAGLLLW